MPFVIAHPDWMRYTDWMRYNKNLREDLLTACQES